MYLNGCCGDVNPIRHRSGYEGAAEVGAGLGATIAAAVKAMLAASAGGTEVDASTVRCLVTTVAVPLDAMETVEEAKAFEQQQKAWLDEAETAYSEKDTGLLWQLGIQWGDVPETMAPSACCTYAEELVAKAEKGGGAKTMEFDVHVIALGDSIAVVGMPGEMFSEYQLKLQAASPFKTTMVLGYTNGCHGYFATKAE